MPPTTIEIYHFKDEKLYFIHNIQYLTNISKHADEHIYVNIEIPAEIHDFLKYKQNKECKKVISCKLQKKHLGHKKCFR